jgi:outer membrane protein TolC
VILETVVMKYPRIKKSTTLLSAIALLFIPYVALAQSGLDDIRPEPVTRQASAQIAAHNQPVLTLNIAQSLALADEHGIRSLLQSGEAMIQRGRSGQSWQDPTIKFGVSNLPTDSFDLDQEAMTQLKLGITQPLPRGDSNTLNAAALDYQAASQTALARERALQVRQTVAISWLELWYAEQAAVVYRSDKILFDDLLAVTESLYRVGKRNQTDVLQAQLEIDKQMDGFHRWQSQVNSRRAGLSQWLPKRDSQRPLPLVLQPAKPLTAVDYQQLLTHPSVIAVDHQMSAQRKQLALAKEAYKPAWAVTVEYGKRYAEDNSGEQLPDMLTAVVSVDVPLFTANRQDPLYQASQHDLSSVTEQRGQLLRQMRAELDSALAQNEQLQRRQQLYKNRLLPTAEQNAVVTISAYRSGSGSFKEVVDSRLAVQQARLNLLRMNTDLAISASQLQYFLRPLNREILLSYSQH